MSENATNSSKRKMDCGRVARDEILESYLLSRLSEEDRDAFEQHYFECARCFDELQTLQAIRDELPRVRVECETKSAHPLIRWAPAAGLAAACPGGNRRALDAPVVTVTRSDEHAVTGSITRRAETAAHTTGADGWARAFARTARAG